LFGFVSVQARAKALNSNHLSNWFKRAVKVRDWSRSDVKIRLKPAVNEQIVNKVMVEGQFDDPLLLSLSLYSNEPSCGLIQDSRI
jgi:hypothetical protein